MKKLLLGITFFFTRKHCTEMLWNSVIQIALIPMPSKHEHKVAACLDAVKAGYGAKVLRIDTHEEARDK